MGRQCKRNTVCWSSSSSCACILACATNAAAPGAGFGDGDASRLAPLDDAAAPPVVAKPAREVAPPLPASLELLVAP
eukprot:scaffold153055_cov21-Tisochrysis_lutea.AAC.1